MKTKAIISFCLAGALAACAENPDNVQAGYSSSTLYESFTCQQLATEARTVSDRAHDAAKVQRRNHTRDEVAAAAGLVVFWPALLFIHGNDATTSEIGQLRGEMAAVEQASARKRCGIVFHRT